MKSYSHLFEILIDKEGIRQDILNASKGKRDKKHVIKYAGDLSQIDTKSEKTPEMENTINRIYDMYINGFELKRRAKTPIRDGITRKEREIVKPKFFPDQIMHHGIVRVLTKNLKIDDKGIPENMTGIITDGMYEYSCGCIPGRGAHYGKKHIEKWIKDDPASVKYIAKLDIRKFFDSVSVRLLKKLLKNKIKDKEFLIIVFKFLSLYRTGLVLGFVTSHWFGNFILQIVDYFLKQEVFKDLVEEKRKNYIAKMTRKGTKNINVPKFKPGVEHMIRYIDDIVIFGRNKKELHLAVSRLGVFLKEKLGLILKKNWQIFRFKYTDKVGKIKGRLLDFMGFVFGRDKTTLRKSILLRITRKINRIKKKGKVTWHDANSMMSYLGWIWHTDAYNIYLEYIKPHIKIKTLKKLISKHQKKERMMKLEGMAKGNKQYKTA